MPNPPEDEGLHVVRRDEPEPHLIYGNLDRPDQPFAVQPERDSNFSIFAFAGTFILLLLAGLIVWVHFHESKSEPRAPVIGVEQLNKTLPVDASPSPPLSATTVVPILPDMLRVSSIALGETPLAIVNGKRLAEGDRLEVKTEKGVGTVLVEKIEDGIVHFRNGENLIDAKLSLPSPPQRPR